MNDSALDHARDTNRARWRRQSESWAARAPAGRSADDDLNQALIAAAAVAPGQSVLDIAAGTGEPSISIALRIGGRGRLVTTDLTAEMLGMARRRASALDLANISFTTADMESLPFAEASFDALTCRFGVMFPPDRSAAAAEAFRVLKPGATAAFMVWGPEADNTVHRTLGAAVQTHFGEPPGLPAQRHVLGAPGALNALLEGAGFGSVAEQEIRHSRIVPEGENFWGQRFERNYSSRLADMTAAGRDALKQAIWAAFEPDRVDGGWRVETHVRIGVGARAG